MSGCAICVYDLHEEALSKYKETIARITSSLREMNVSESEWPSELLSSNEDRSDGGTNGKSPSMTAFEELERKLKAKKETRDSKMPQISMTKLLICQNRRS